MFKAGDAKKNMYFKTDAEIELIRVSCLVVCKVLEEVGKMLRPGITGRQLDTMAEALIRDHGGIPAFKGYRDFPDTLCISVNEQVVHGIPSNTEFKDGDVVSVDCGVILNGFVGDAAYTFAIGGVPPRVIDLLRATNTSLYKGIEQAVHGKRIGDIGWAIQNYCEKVHPYGVVRDLVGHGVGKDLHEDPEVPNHGKRGNGVVLRDGLVIAIEPMVNMGTKDVRQAADNWTIVTRDGKPSAHYEHTIAIRKGRADILSDHTKIVEAVKNNSELVEISIKK
jgi:methionyl aminopeptidase